MSHKKSAAPGRDLRRFLRQLERLRTALGEAQVPGAAGPEGLFGHALYAKGGRTPLFMLQGLARVYRKLELDDDAVEVFDRLRLESKIIEDALGAIDFWWVVQRKVRENKLPKGVGEWAEHQHIEACGRAATWLEAREWVLHRYIEDPETFESRADRFDRRLRRLDWPSPKKFRGALTAFLSQSLVEVDAKLAALDLSDIEGGLHETRRQVRWFSVYATALDGAIALDPEAPAPDGWEQYLVPDVVESQFNRLPAPEEGDLPLYVPAPLFYALSYLIDRLGVIKDRVQWTETLAHGLGEAGGARGRTAASYLGAAGLDPAEGAAQAAELVEQVLRKDRLLARLAEAIGG